MRAEQAMMVGVGLLGAFAVYKMVTAKPSAPAPGTPGATGTVDSAGRPTGDNLVMLVDPLDLRQGQYFRARLAVGNITPFTASATPDALAQALTGLGFSNVTMYMSQADLPSDWPGNTMASPTPATRWFQGMWNAPTIHLPKPAAIESIWVTASPALVAARAVPAAPVQPVTAVSTSGYGRMTG